MASTWSSRSSGGTRDAVLVNGLAMLAGCISIALAVILRPNDQAFGPGLGVALSATGILLVWSLTLAVRAWRRGEHNGWVWAAMVLGGLETVLLCIIAYLIRFVIPFSGLFHWAYWTGVIVFLPVGAIAYLGAVPVTWWRLRCAARRDANTGIQNQSHWKRGLIWFCAVGALLVALLLPCPLFLYCSEWQCEAEYEPWMRWVVENTPVFVADPAAGAVALSSRQEAVGLYHWALMSGRVSKKRLLAEVNSTTFGQGAFWGLEQADPQAALDLADQIGQGRASCRRLQYDAGTEMGRNGTQKRIRYFFDQDATQSPPNSDFMDGLVFGLSRRPEFLPEIASFCRKDFRERGNALGTLAGMLPAKDVPGVWAEFLAGRNPSLREEAIWAITRIRDANARIAVLVAGFESPDPAIRQDMWLSYPPRVFFYEWRSSGPAQLKRLIQCLLHVVDDTDQRLRCAAAYGLSWLLNDHESLRKEFCFFERLVKLHFSERFGPPVWAASGEQDMLESVRAAAKKWLDEQDSSPKSKSQNAK